ncbi:MULTISPECIES: replication initiation protein [Photorhabdus]
MKFKITGDRLVSLNGFKTMLGIKDKHLQFRGLNKLLLKPAIKEPNKKNSDFNHHFYIQL